MALWNEKPTPAAAGSAVPPSAPPPERNPPERNVSEPALAVSPRRPTPKTSSEGGESVIAANLTIEGKIEGSGNVRMAGRFKGDVRIDGNFSIESGAHLTGQVLASIVVVATNGFELLIKTPTIAPKPVTITSGRPSPSTSATATE